MKNKKNIIAVLTIAAIAVIAVARLVSNKQSFDEELKMVSESNTTIPVITDTVKYRKAPCEFSVNGSFSASKEISIASETQGKVISINVKTGDKVSAGQVVASIDNKIYASQLELAKLTLEKTERDMKRYEKLAKGDAASVQQYESAKQEFEIAQSAYTTAKIQFENTNIRAPFEGIITKQHIGKGAYISPGSFVFDIVSINKVKFIAKLTGNEAAKVQKGKAIKLNVENYPGIIFDGLVSAVIVKSDLSKRYDVEVEVTNNPDNLIKPGMFGSCKFSQQSDEQMLVIPRAALTGSIKNPEVFIVKKDSVISRSISATTIDEKCIAVKQGLNEGDVIVLSGQINLVNGSKIKLNN